MWNFRFIPEQASSVAGRVDTVFFVLIGLSGFIILGVSLTVLYFILKYRNGRDADRSNPVYQSTGIEMTWITIPAILALGMFVWAGSTYFEIKQVPEGENIEIYVTGKRWMWKFQHQNGAREIDELHVPLGRTVRLVMTSEDVIHSLFIPAFRIKQDVVPGMYSDQWFKPTKAGQYHIFCAELCGTQHSNMRGRVYVMEPAEYERWLELGSTGGSNTEPGTGRVERTPTTAPEGPLSPPEAGQQPLLPGPSHTTLPPEAQSGETRPVPNAMAAAGQQLFDELRCSTCHRVSSEALYPAQGPRLDGIYGRQVSLQNGREILADEQYLRESILYPQAKLAQGYPAVMPTFQGQITEEQLMQLIAYLKTL